MSSFGPTVKLYLGIFPIVRAVSMFLFQTEFKQIRDLTFLAQWRYVESKESPADYASRGLYAQDLIDKKEWWHGPNYPCYYSKSSWLNRQNENSLETHC